MKGIVHPNKVKSQDLLMQMESDEVSCSPLSSSGAPQHNSTAALSKTSEEHGDIKMKQLTNQKVKQNKIECLYTDCLL